MKRVRAEQVEQDLALALVPVSGEASLWLDSCEWLFCHGQQIPDTA